MSRQEAGKVYSNGVINDSLSWQLRGFVDFYPEHNPLQIKKAFLESIKDFRECIHESPFQALTNKTHSLFAGTVYHLSKNFYDQKLNDFDFNSSDN